MNKVLSRIDLYLGDIKESYKNTDKENELLSKFTALYSYAREAQDRCEHASPDNLDKWRRAYLGTLNALTQDGTESKRKSRQLRKVAYEIVESTIDNSIPMPKMQARYKDDLHLVEVTENYLKYEMERILTRFNNDRSERATYIDGTGWYKVWWDSLDNKHERSGNVKVEFCSVDQIIPQPGVKDYKQLEYIFERQRVSIAKIYDVYGRVVTPNDGEMVDVVNCYYLNNNRIVGLFSWCEMSGQVICNEEDWQIRKIRKCQVCDTVNNTGDTCVYCGSKKIKYSNAKKEVLSEPLVQIYNPYESGETDDFSARDELSKKTFANAGDEIPFYELRQLPFVPRPAVSTVDTIYGISEVRIVLEMQDGTNKTLTKAIEKTLKSGTVVTKPEKMKINDTDDTFKIFGVRSAEEAQMVQAKQIMADVSQDMAMASILYDSAKSSSGITDSFQGKSDSTAISGKAKQYAAMQSAGRIQSMREMKSAAFSGVYELILKYLLAFSDETRKFVRVLPDGTELQECWNKYMFLDRDKNGEIYYRDDFTFNCDAASTLNTNRVQMWQETQDKFVQGAFGAPNDPRTLKLFWNTMNSLQYPLATIALAGIKESEQHLPFEVEQAIMQNPQLMQMISQVLIQGDGRGGARPNSGPKGNGATHSANVERTNERNRASNRDVEAFSAQGGVGNANT
jgi:hypothetical protein